MDHGGDWGVPPCFNDRPDAFPTSISGDQLITGFAENRIKDLRLRLRGLEGAIRPKPNWTRRRRRSRSSAALDPTMRSAVELHGPEAPKILSQDRTQSATPGIGRPCDLRSGRANCSHAWLVGASEAHGFAGGRLWRARRRSRRPLRLATSAWPSRPCQPKRLRAMLFCASGPISCGGHSSTCPTRKDDPPCTPPF